MLKFLLNRQLDTFAKRYGYDVGYMRAVAAVDPLAMARFGLINAMGTYRRVIPAAPYFAAKLRTIVIDDCGPCTQLVVNMALEAGVPGGVIEAIVRRDLASLDPDTALVARFAEYTLAHALEADPLREDIRNRWGEPGLISVAFAISSTRVYAALKYALGYGHACTRVQVGDASFAPQRLALQSRTFESTT